MELIISGKDCMSLVRNVRSDITKGDIVEASRKLDNLKSSGLKLANMADQRAKVFEKIETNYLQQAEELQREIGRLGQQEADLEKNKSITETKLESEEDELQRNMDTLSDSRSKLSNAERIRQEKEETERSRRDVGRVVGGAVLAGFAGLLGWFAGEKLGEGVGQLLNDLYKDEEIARREVEACQRTYDSVYSTVTSLKQEVWSLQHQISQLADTIAMKTSERHQINKEAKKMKEAVEFFLRASVFWQEFKQFTDDGIDHTSLIRSIIAKAEEIGDTSCLYGDASEAIGMTFIEVWEMMETKLYEGSNEFTVHFDFKCNQCCRKIQHFPYLHEDNEFVCHSCHSQ